MALAMRGEDPEFNQTWEQAMNGPLREGHMEAARTEHDTLVDMGAWEIVDREVWMNVLPSLWIVKKKLFPDGTVRKLKGRICVGGHRQIKGVDYWSTFAPTVSWTTLRLMLILSAQLGLVTQQVDYTAAFIHADIDLPPGRDDMPPEEQAKVGVHMEMPRGFTQKGKVLTPKKSVYALTSLPETYSCTLSPIWKPLASFKLLKLTPACSYQIK